MRDQNNYGPQKMYQGNWTCAQCGKEINELPFEPDGERPVYCPSCHRERRQSRSIRLVTEIVAGFAVGPAAIFEILSYAVYVLGN